MRELILVAGMSRGGTNLLWNIVQSHPKIIDSYYELNEIFGSKTNIPFFAKAKIESSALFNLKLAGNAELIRSRIEGFAQQSFSTDKYNKFKSPDKEYGSSEFSELTITTKLVSAWESEFLRKALRRNDALKYLPQMEAAYPGMKVIFLIRNGLAVAEGWGRRGATIETAARWYRKYVLFYENYISLSQGRAMIIKFEDLLEDPFNSAQKAFDFLALPFSNEMPLRIAIKPTIRANKDVVNTTEKQKVWMTETNFSEYLDAKINSAQIEKLNKNKIESFTEFNRDILERYGYI